jgi:hypothetical protein
MGIPMNYGECDGGPWHKKHLAHPEPTMDVEIETFSKKVRPGVRRGTPGYVFGLYRFDESARCWRYEPPSEDPKRVDKKTR